MKRLIYILLVVGLSASFAEARESDVSTRPCFQELKVKIERKLKDESFEKTVYVNETGSDVESEVHYRVLFSPKSWQGETFYQQLMMFDAKTCKLNLIESGGRVGFFNKIVID